MTRTDWIQFVCDAHKKQLHYEEIGYYKTDEEIDKARDELLDVLTDLIMKDDFTWREAINILSDGLDLFIDQMTTKEAC